MDTLCDEIDKITYRISSLNSHDVEAQKEYDYLSEYLTYLKEQQMNNVNKF